MKSTLQLHRVDMPAKAHTTTLAERYDDVRAASLALALPLSDEDCAIQSMPDASPVKWHLAHTSWFFETFVLAASVAGYTAFDPTYRMLFNSYYNAVGDKHPRPQRGLLSRPSRAEVVAYRRHVDAAMRSLLQHLESLSPDVASLVVARNQPRAAAPGADPHRRPAHALAQSDAAGVSSRRRAR